LIGAILRGGEVRQNLVPIDGALIYGLMPSDDVLKQRINDRVEAMFKSGLVEEVKALIEKYGRPNKKMDAIGYPICMSYIDGELAIDEAKEKFKNAHWQYARRQKSWFKRNPYIVWSNTDKQAMNTIIKDVEASVNKSVTIET
jgi:tRNA dimethylallyltransferase